jgi:hypothetical protein
MFPISILAWAILVFCFARLKTGNSMPARMPMIAITTSSSMSVKAELLERFSCEVIVCLRCREYGNAVLQRQDEFDPTGG